MPSADRRRKAAACVVALVVGCLGVLAPAPVAAQGLPDPTHDADEVRQRADQLASELGGGQGGQGGGQGGQGGGQGGGGQGGGGAGGGPELPEPPDLPEPPSADVPTPPFEGLGAVGQVLVWVVAALLVAGGVWLIVRLVRSRRRREQDEEDENVTLVDADDDLRPDDPPLTDAEAWRRRADEAEAAGDRREAVRCRWRSMVAELASAGALDEIRGRTSGELVAALADARSPAAEVFAQATRRFEDAWYGARDPGPDGCAAMVELQGALTDALASAPSPVGSPA